MSARRPFRSAGLDPERDVASARPHPTEAEIRWQRPESCCNPSTPHKGGAFRPGLYALGYPGKFGTATPSSLHRGSRGASSTPGLCNAGRQTSPGTKRVLLKAGVRHSRAETHRRVCLPGPYRPLRSTKLAIFVLNKRKKQLMPCPQKRARLLLTRGRAVAGRRALRRRDGILRYRPHGFDDRTRAMCRLGLSVWHRVGTCMSRVGRLRRWAPVLAAYGFPRGYCMRTKSVCGFKTGDMVRAEVPKGKQAGIHVGRVAVRASGSVRVGDAEGINANYCKLLHRADGYGYACGPALSLQLKPGVLSAAGTDDIRHSCRVILSL
jgi:hypothetical protein